MPKTAKRQTKRTPEPVQVARARMKRGQQLVSDLEHRAVFALQAVEALAKWFEEIASDYHQATKKAVR